MQMTGEFVDVILLKIDSHPRRQCMKLWPGFIWLRIGSSEHGNEHFGSIKSITLLD
jgi:hypothetical protein